jgi:eukaryotic-like serine/threonine-protein kinase
MGAYGARLGRVVLAGPVRRRRTESRLASADEYAVSVGRPAATPGGNGRGTAPGAEHRNQMRRPDTTTVPEGEPTVRLGSGRAHGRVVLDRYRLDQRLGAGGFGVVWRAHDLKLERDVAVKAVPRSGSEAEQSRTEREALAAARLNHPGIVALYEFGYDDEEIYLVSELVEGASLAQLMADGAVSDRDVAKIGLALCEALSHAHARGVIHRDVKPANVMVLAEPAAGSGFAKLTDLGVAHVAAADDLTSTGDVVGTLAYMAPEQADGRRVTPACDVYALALTLYEAWTGTNPVRARGPAATARRVGLALPPLRSLRRDLPPELAEVVDAALDPDPDYRPDPAELRGVLAEVAWWSPRRWSASG